MSQFTVTTAAVHLDEAFSKEIVHHTESRLVLWDRIKRYDDLVKDSSDRVQIPFDSELAANDKVKGVSVSPQNPTDTDVTLLLDSHKESSVFIEDIVELQSHDGVRERYAKNAGYAVAKAMDTELASHATGFSNNSGTYNTAITTDTLLDAIEILDLGDVPMEDRHFVYRGDVRRDLLDISTYTSQDFVSGKPVESGMLSGSLYGVEAVMSNNIQKSGNNTSNMLFHREAIAGAMQRAPRAQVDYELREIGNLLVVDAVFGSVELRDAFGVEIRT